MPSTFTHKGVRFDVTSRYDNQFEITILLDGETIRTTVRTRLLELAKRRSEMLINRKLKERTSPV